MKEIFHILKTYFINFQYITNLEYNDIKNVFFVLMFILAFFNILFLLNNILMY